VACRGHFEALCCLVAPNLIELRDSNVAIAILISGIIERRVRALMLSGGARSPKPNCHKFWNQRQFHPVPIVDYRCHTSAATVLRLRSQLASRGPYRHSPPGAISAASIGTTSSAAGLSNPGRGVHSATGTTHIRIPLEACVASASHGQHRESPPPP